MDFKRMKPNFATMNLNPITCIRLELKMLSALAGDSKAIIAPRPLSLWN
jgi:hypothetical protein